MVVKNTSQIIIDLYRKRAGNYDISANLYYLIGFREQKYKRWQLISLFSLTSEPHTVSLSISYKHNLISINGLKIIMVEYQS